jgi:AcrR family transcriptional regulator
MSTTDGRQLRWQRHKAQRRRVVIDAAIAVLQRREPGAEIHVRDIADEAGINRSSVYRHFDDRGDLDLAVQREICDRAGGVLLPALALDGTPRDIVRRIVDAYIRWAVAHPALVRFAEQDLPGASAKPLDEALEQVARQIELVIGGFVSALGADLDVGDRDALEPWVFGLIGGCFEAVRRWTAREALSPGVDDFVDLMTDAVWFQIDGLASSRGITVPDLPVEQLLASLETAS